MCMPKPKGLQLVQCPGLCLRSDQWQLTSNRCCSCHLCCRACQRQSLCSLDGSCQRDHLSTCRRSLLRSCRRRSNVALPLPMLIRLFKQQRMLFPRLKLLAMLIPFPRQRQRKHRGVPPLLCQRRPMPLLPLPFPSAKPRSPSWRHQRRAWWQRSLQQQAPRRSLWETLRSHRLPAPAEKRHCPWQEKRLLKTWKRLPKPQVEAAM
mmetsp:Transcript_69444/g.122840  ORF Transcript_69444/g.122840 Transcript_69444/m.122840 type:complete len:206 (-) Transcript_69444:291-908(-)